MLLYSVQKLREELGFDAMSDITNAITMALDAAETLVGSTLRTTFERKTVTDTFYVNEPSFQQGGLVRTEFLLSTGFVAGTPVVTSSKLGIISDAFQFDKEKGIARDWQTRYGDDIVTIEFTAGFEPASATDGEDSYKLADVPSWLQQAAKLKTQLLIAKLPALTEAGIHLDTNVLDQQYASLVNSHIRYAPSALLPL
ncbi:hypothetical protein [Hyphomicrobium sp. ghe19]|uniref:hypothetical protein n=1 Tax=Hyphomicrobium sp. ghe19 TaxID=2682968 RepID=UPI00136760D3|nr:hypothetical protein HYPP_02506 [Hyphomicrobium sp. ghe19]